MRTRTLTEIVRDAALDDDFGTDRALVLVQRLNHVYGRDPATKKVLAELVDILAGIQERQRAIHQAAEQDYQRHAAGRQDAANAELRRQDEAELEQLAQLL